MNNFAINQLANMEFMLYGSRAGMNMNCPNYYNGYMGAGLNNFGLNNYYNPSFKQYGNYNQDIFTKAYEQQNNTAKTNNSTQSSAQGSNYNPQFQGITQEDMDKLADYYAKNNALEEGFTGALTGGLSWMAFEHAQSVFHPQNAWKGAKEAKEIFKVLPKDFAAKNAALLQDAQIAVQQVVRDTGSKGWWSKWIRKPLYIDNPEKIAKMDAAARQINQANKAEITRELNAMKQAVRTRNVKGIAEATARLQATRGMDGKIAGLISKGKTVTQRLSEKTSSGAIKKEAENLIKMNESVITNNFGNLAKSFLKKDFVGFMIFETIFSAGKIMTALQKDTKTGIEQICQSVGKAGLGTAGWCVGRAAGTLLGAKIGATLGIAGGPVGAAVGALIGFTVGSVGMWAGHKLGNAIFGHDVADKIEAKNMTKTQDGQTELLKFALEKAQEGKTDAKTTQIVSKALNAYA